MDDKFQELRRERERKKWREERMKEQKEERFKFQKKGDAVSEGEEIILSSREATEELDKYLVADMDKKINDKEELDEEVEKKIQELKEICEPERKENRIDNGWKIRYNPKRKLEYGDYVSPLDDLRSRSPSPLYYKDLNKENKRIEWKPLYLREREDQERKREEKRRKEDKRRTDEKRRRDYEERRWREDQERKREEKRWKEDKRGTDEKERKEYEEKKWRKDQRRKHEEEKRKNYDVEMKNEKRKSIELEMNKERKIQYDKLIDPPPFACFNCWETGHIAVFCKKIKSWVYCFSCGRKGVITKYCPRCKDDKKKIIEKKEEPKEERKSVFSRLDKKNSKIDLVKKILENSSINDIDKEEIIKEILKE